MYCYDPYGNVVYCAAQQSQQANPIVQAFSNPVVLILWVACALLCAFIAQAKNRPVGRAVIVGLLTGLLGVIVYAVISTLPKAEPTPTASPPVT